MANDIPLSKVTAVRDALDQAEADISNALAELDGAAKLGFAPAGVLAKALRDLTAYRVETRRVHEVVGVTVTGLGLTDRNIVLGVIDDMRDALPDESPSLEPDTRGFGADDMHDMVRDILGVRS